jgi:hypothetical protein
LPEPVSDARRNCFQLGLLIEAVTSDLSRSHFKLNDWIGVGVAIDPRTSVRRERIPGRSGGEENFVGSGCVAFIKFSPVKCWWYLKGV